MKRWWRRVRPVVLSRFAFWLVRFLGSTWRIQVLNYEAADQVEGGKILCGWHGRSMIASVYFRKQGFWVIISKSKDGDIQTHVFENLGFQVIRGSTGRGGERALIESIRELRKGSTMAITPDGPRGPNKVIQGGIMLMAKKANAWLVPCGVSARPRFLAKSWDRYMVPLPFARCIMIFGEPVRLPEDATDEQIEEVRLQLQAECSRLEDEAERMMGYSVTG